MKGTIVSLLESILSKNKLINFKLLISQENKKKYEDCIGELKKLINLHPEIQIDCRESLKDKGRFESHDRYIIIDEVEIYHSGHSLGQLGEASSSIIRMRALTKKKKVLDDLKSQFDNAQKVTL